MMLRLSFVVAGAIALAAEGGRHDAYVALGVVIRGETYHFELVSNESGRGIMDLTLAGHAIGNGILTVENEAQAIVRAGPILPGKNDADQKGDKGGGAAKAAIRMLEIAGQFSN